MVYQSNCPSRRRNVRDAVGVGLVADHPLSNHPLSRMKEAISILSKQGAWWCARSALEAPRTIVGSLKRVGWNRARQSCSQAGTVPISIGHRCCSYRGPRRLLLHCSGPGRRGSCLRLDQSAALTPPTGLAFLSRFGWRRARCGGSKAYNPTCGKVSAKSRSRWPGWSSRKENNFPYRRAQEDLRDMEQTQEHLMHHRDVLRWSLRRA